MFDKSSDYRVLTPAQIARMFGVDPKTVARWDKDGKFIKSVRTPGGHRRYPVSKVIEYLNNKNIVIEGLND